MRKTLLMLVLLVTSQFVSATPTAQQCLSEMVYYEARSLPKSEWLHVAAVAVHRSKTKGFPKTVCAVVKHREFTTSKYFGGFKKDKEVYKQIKVAISDNLSKLKTPHLFFSSNRKGRMRFH